MSTQARNRGTTSTRMGSAAIGLISCYKGFTCRPGAEGVGAATTESFVTSFLAIILQGLVLAKVLNDVAYWLLGGVSSVFT